MLEHDEVTVILRSAIALQPSPDAGGRNLDRQSKNKEATARCTKRTKLPRRRSLLPNPDEVML